MANKLKSYLSAINFRSGKSPEDILEMLYAAKSKGGENYISFGKLYGHGITSEVMEQRDERYKDKEPSIKIVGKFRFISDITGEISDGMGVIVPAFFSKMLQAQIKQSPEGTSFAVEIGVELTGRTIPWAWAVVNLLPEEPDSKFGQLETMLQSRNLLVSHVETKQVSGGKKAA